eukprot:m51a1_g1105 hypothetical protein (320) ;mRNA; r:126419-127598
MGAGTRRLAVRVALAAASAAALAYVAFVAARTRPRRPRSPRRTTFYALVLVALTARMGQHVFCAVAYQRSLEVLLSADVFLAVVPSVLLCYACALTMAMWGLLWDPRPSTGILVFDVATAALTAAAVVACAALLAVDAATVGDRGVLGTAEAQWPEQALKWLGAAPFVLFFGLFFACMYATWLQHRPEPPAPHRVDPSALRFVSRACTVAWAALSCKTALLVWAIFASGLEHGTVWSAVHYGVAEMAAVVALVSAVAACSTAKWAAGPGECAALLRSTCPTTFTTSPPVVDSPSKARSLRGYGNLPVLFEQLTHSPISI